MTTGTGVHEAHCCKEHGCKYGDADCPVVAGTARQKYACEDCQPQLTVDDIGHIEDLRQRRGLKEDDTSEDAEILKIDPFARVKELSAWTLGSPGWADQFKSWCESQGIFLTTNQDDPEIIV